MPIEPPPSVWDFPTPEQLRGVGPDDLIAAGADLAPGTLLSAYRSSLFPMPDPEGSRRIHWFSPGARGVLPLNRLRVTRSLRKACARFEIRVDTAFEDVIDACADPGRDGGWIDDEIRTAYVDLHRMGWAHSVEAWTRDGQLAGGLYGVAIGGLFAGESMFHHERDASKVALVGLVELMRAASSPEQRLLDVQWRTDHLATLGVCEIPRIDYLDRLEVALELDSPFPT